MKGQWLIGVTALVLLGCEASAPPSETATTSTEYQYVTPSRDGIGKTYLGREISHVMGHRGAGWLERSTRQQEERTDLLIDALPLTPNSVVADIGAGTGYFSFPIAKRVPEGRVLAVDIQPEMLEIIRRRVAAGNVTNVETVLGTADDPRLPSGEVDLILLVDAYHEFEDPRSMGLAMRDALRPGGKVVLVEYRGEDPAVPIKRLHKMTEAQAKREMSAIDLAFVENLRVLPQQHILVFEKAAN